MREINNIIVMRNGISNSNDTDSNDLILQALTETITNIGQLSKSEIKILDKAVKQGILSKGKSGGFPILKTVYAPFAFDFVAARNEAIETAMALAKLDGNKLKW